MQVTNLELAHQFVHGVTIQKLLVAYDADIPSTLLPRFNLIMLFLGLIWLNRVGPLLEKTFGATQFTTEIAVFELPVLGVSATVAPGPLLNGFTLVFWYLFGHHKYGVVHIEHDMNFVIHLDL